MFYGQNVSSTIAKIVNSQQTNVLLLTGNIYDLFYDGTCYVPLVPFLQKKYSIDPTDNARGLIRVVYDVNGSIDVYGSKEELYRRWNSLKLGEHFDDWVKEAKKSSVVALELLRQLTICFRKSKGDHDLLIIIEGADMLIPEGEISRLGTADRKRIAIMQDWLNDPEFTASHDRVIMIAESRSQLHNRVAKLPQILSVPIALPTETERKSFIEDDKAACLAYEEFDVKRLPAYMAPLTSGLSLVAIRQLLRSRDFSLDNICNKVEEFLIGQLGEGVVEFKRVSHTVDDVVGNRRVKKYFKEVVIPGFELGGKDAISGLLVAGSIGSGKTFTCEAVAGDLGIPVIILKEIRSQWYGGTDIIWERLQRVLESFWRVCIFVDEADTQFGSVQDGHETERRLTGKIQAMMSDTRLRGRVLWFLMTARPHCLSPDIRRPGRMDIVIPILDPDQDDKREFLKWTFGDLIGEQEMNSQEVKTIFQSYSAASFDLLRRELRRNKVSTFEAALAIANDMLMPDIGLTRRYQEIQAILNCTRASLLGDKSASEIVNDRVKLLNEASNLEQMGIK